MSHIHISRGELLTLLERARAEGRGRDVMLRLEWFLHYAEHDSIRLTCKQFGIARTTFYRWLKRFDAKNLSTLEDLPTVASQSAILSPEKVPVPKREREIIALKTIVTHREAMPMREALTPPPSLSPVSVAVAKAKRPADTPTAIDFQEKQKPCFFCRIQEQVQFMRLPFVFAVLVISMLTNVAVISMLSLSGHALQGQLKATTPPVKEELYVLAPDELCAEKDKKTDTLTKTSTEDTSQATDCQLIESKDSRRCLCHISLTHEQ